MRVEVAHEVEMILGGQPGIDGDALLDCQQGVGVADQVAADGGVAEDGKTPEQAPVAWHVRWKFEVYDLCTHPLEVAAEGFGHRGVQMNADRPGWEEVVQELQVLGEGGEVAVVLAPQGVGDDVLCPIVGIEGGRWFRRHRGEAGEAGEHPVFRLQRGAAVLHCEIGAADAPRCICQAIMRVGAGTAAFEGAPASLDRPTIVTQRQEQHAMVFVQAG